MPKSGCSKKCLLLPKWEEKYVSSTKLSHFVDHANERSLWTGPRSRCYGDDGTTVGGEASPQQCGETLPEPIANFPDSADISERYTHMRLSCASKTNAIVKNFLTQGCEPKRCRSHRRGKSSSTSRSGARKVRGCSVDSDPCSPPPSHCGASANSESAKDGTVLREVVAGQRVSNHKVMEHLTSIPRTGELCVTPLHSESASTQDSARRTRSPKPSYSEVPGNSEPICELPDHHHSSRPKKVVTLSNLLIQAKGPDQSLLCRRISAKGPDPSLHRGPNPSLVRGPNPILLRKNRL